MSIELMSAIWRLDLPTNRKIVLLKMADVADDDGRNSFQSIEFIAAHTGQGERTVKRHRMEFEKRGILVVEAYGKGGRGRFKNFRIDIDRAREIYGIIKRLEKGAKLAPFIRKGANDDEKGAKSNTKGCQSLAPDSSLFISKDSSRAESGAAPKGAPASAPVGDGVAPRWRRQPRNHGIQLEPVDDAPWQRLKAEIAGRVGDEPVRTWLDMLTFVAMRDGVVHLSAPSETIQKFARQVAADGLGDMNRVNIALRTAFRLPREPDHRSEKPNSDTWKPSTPSSQHLPAKGGHRRSNSRSPRR